VDIAKMSMQRALARGMSPTRQRTSHRISRRPVFFIDASIGPRGTVNQPSPDAVDMKQAFYQATGAEMFFNESELYNRILSRSQQGRCALDVKHTTAYKNVPKTVDEARDMLADTHGKMTHDRLLLNCLKETAMSNYSKRIAMLEDVLSDLYAKMYEDFVVEKLQTRMVELDDRKRALQRAMQQLKQKNILRFDATEMCAKSGVYRCLDKSSHKHASDLLKANANKFIGRELHCLHVLIAKEHVGDANNDFRCPISMNLMQDPVTIYALDPKNIHTALPRNYERKRWFHIRFSESLVLLFVLSDCFMKWVCRDPPCMY